eukprot:6441050-Alexandrium_andersonii.AAC.1
MLTAVALGGAVLLASSISRLSATLGDARLQAGFRPRLLRWRLCRSSSNPRTTATALARSGRVSAAGPRPAHVARARRRACLLAAALRARALTGG